MADEEMNTYNEETLTQGYVEEMNTNNEDSIPEGQESEEDDFVNDEEDLDFHEIDFGGINEEQVRTFRFLSNEAAYEFYRLYGIKKGFGIRKYQIRRDKDDELLWQSFVCDREGYREKNNNLVRQRASRKSTRCGCQARLKVHVDKENRGWYVSKFSDEHTHELIGEHYGGMIAANRRMSDTDIGQMNTMREI